MSNKSCRLCYYCDFCSGDEICDNYAPVGEDTSYIDIDRYIEERGSEFRSEYFRYIEDRNY